MNQEKGAVVNSTDGGLEIKAWPGELVRFQVLTAAGMKMSFFWDVAPCSLVEVYDVSEVLAASIFRAIALTTRCNIPEDSHVQKVGLL
jgi:hypothetical protein